MSCHRVRRTLFLVLFTSFVLHSSVCLLDVEARTKKLDKPPLPLKKAPHSDNVKTTSSGKAYAVLEKPTEEDTEAGVRGVNHSKNAVRNGWKVAKAFPKTSAIADVTDATKKPILTKDIAKKWRNSAYEHIGITKRSVRRSRKFRNSQPTASRRLGVFTKTKFVNTAGTIAGLGSLAGAGALVGVGALAGAGLGALSTLLSLGAAGLGALAGSTLVGTGLLLGAPILIPLAAIGIATKVALFGGPLLATKVAIDIFKVPLTLLKLATGGIKLGIGTGAIGLTGLAGLGGLAGLAGLAGIESGEYDEDELIFFPIEGPHPPPHEMSYAPGLGGPGLGPGFGPGGPPYIEARGGPILRRIFNSCRRRTDCKNLFRRLRRIDVTRTKRGNYFQARSPNSPTTSNHLSGFRAHGRYYRNHGNGLSHYRNHRKTDRRKRSAPGSPSISQVYHDYDDELDRIYHSDSNGCIQRLFCELGKKKVQGLDSDEMALIDLITINPTNSSGRPVGYAHRMYNAANQLGNRGVSCAHIYEKCPLDGNQLMALMRALDFVNL